MRTLRPYQAAAKAAVFDELTRVRSTLAVLPTGCGKTVLFAHAANDWQEGRVIVLAHREELIRQAATKIHDQTGEPVDVEMGDVRSSDTLGHYFRAKVVVGSVQTLCRERRLRVFNPAEFGLLVVDEAHHATANSYRKVFSHFDQNERHRRLGVTATPKRADGLALGSVFDSVAYEYGVLEAIMDGWLVDIEQQMVLLKDVDFSKLKTTAGGDFREEDLEALMIEEGPLHGVCKPLIDLSGNRKAIVFTAGVNHAKRVAEILKRHGKEAIALDGTTDDIARREALQMFGRGDYQFLVNCGLFLEGYDEPTIEIVAVARPTKSTALYLQMIGRGTRTLPGVVDHELINDVDERREAICISSKSTLLVIDFVGNSGRHKLVTCTDALGGKFSDEIVNRAKPPKENPDDGPVNVLSELLKASKEQEVIDEARRRRVVAKVEYSTQKVSAFDLEDAPAARGIGDKTPCTEAQAKLLQRYGYNPSRITKRQAGGIIGQLAANHWRPLQRAS